MTVPEFTASLRALPALKMGTIAASILIGAPVLGLRPTRAARALTENVPNPRKETDFPLCNEAVTESKREFRARVAEAFEISACSAINSIKSVLLTGILLKVPPPYM